MRRGRFVTTALAVGLGLTGWPRPSPAQQGGAEQAPARAAVDSIAVEGNRRVTRETIVNGAAIPLKTPIGYRDIQRALRGLYETSQFDDVRILRKTGPDSIEILVIAVRERPE